MKKGLLAVLFAAVIGLSGCSSSQKEAENTTQPEYVTVTDTIGREVEVPTEVNSVIALGAGALRLVCYAGAQDMVVGVEEGEHTQTLAKGYNYVYYDEFKDLPIIGTGWAGSFDAYEEEIIKVAPDVIFAAYTKELADDLQNKTGIPVVVTNYDEGLLDEKLYESLGLIGQILGREDRCKEVVDKLKLWETDLQERTKDIPDDEKPTVYMGACSYKGGHGIEGSYINYPPFKIIGANSVTDELGDTVGSVIVDLEQIAVWDPDYIFLDPNNMQLVNDDYATNKDYYESLKAVKDGNVYSQVAYNYYTTNVGTAVVDAYYAGKVMFPEKFEDVDIETLADDVYTFLLGEKAAGYYNSLVEGGLGFRQITIGE